MTIDQPTADVIGYTYRAGNYCPSCIIDQLPTGPGGTYDGWALAAGAAPMSTEANLSEIAHAFGIDRHDERTFDSGEFPKIITGDMSDCQGDQCGSCGEYLFDEPEDDNDEPEDDEPEDDEPEDDEPEDDEPEYDEPEDDDDEPEYDEPEDDDDEPEPGDQCEGPLHYTTCWWVVHNDDGRDQATGDPRIDSLTDQEAVAIHLAARAESDEGEMSNGAARTVASWWHGGQSSAGYAFVSTGAIIVSPSELWRELAWPGYDTAGPADKLALDWLGTYLLNREDRGPVAGWSELWVR